MSFSLQFLSQRKKVTKKMIQNKDILFLTQSFHSFLFLFFNCFSHKTKKRNLIQKQRRQEKKRERERGERRDEKSLFHARLQLILSNEKFNLPPGEEFFATEKRVCRCRYILSRHRIGPRHGRHDYCFSSAKIAFTWTTYRC